MYVVPQVFKLNDGFPRVKFPCNLLVLLLGNMLRAIILLLKTAHRPYNISVQCIYIHERDVVTPILFFFRLFMKMIGMVDPLL
jgi:hypothetical protein